MKESPSPPDRLKIAFISDDAVLVKRFFGFALYSNINWQIHAVSTLRLLAPSENLEQFDGLIYWFDERQEQAHAKQFLYTGEAPQHNTVSGFFESLQEHPFSQDLMKRIIVISSGLSRKDIHFFAVKGLTNILSTPDDWKDSQILNWIHLIDKLFHKILAEANSQDNQGNWESKVLAKIINWNHLTPHEQ